MEYFGSQYHPQCSQYSQAEEIVNPSLIRVRTTEIGATSEERIHHDIFSQPEHSTISTTQTSQSFSSFLANANFQHVPKGYMHMSEQDCIRTISQSIRTTIMHTCNDDFRKTCYEMLGVNSSEDAESEFSKIFQHLCGITDENSTSDQPANLLGHAPTEGPFNVYASHEEIGAHWAIPPTPDPSSPSRSQTSSPLEHTENSGYQQVVSGFSDELFPDYEDQAENVDPCHEQLAQSIHEAFSQTSTSLYSKNLHNTVASPTAHSTQQESSVSPKSQKNGNVTESSTTRDSRLSRSRSVSPSLLEDVEIPIDEDEDDDVVFLDSFSPLQVCATQFRSETSQELEMSQTHTRQGSQNFTSFIQDHAYQRQTTKNVNQADHPLDGISNTLTDPEVVPNNILSQNRKRSSWQHPYPQDIGSQTQFFSQENLFQQRSSQESGSQVSQIRLSESQGSQERISASNRLLHTGCSSGESGRSSSSSKALKDKYRSLTRNKLLLRLASMDK